MNSSFIVVGKLPLGDFEMIQLQEIEPRDPIIALGPESMSLNSSSKIMRPQEFPSLKPTRADEVNEAKSNVCSIRHNISE